jgi:hypothetical protein
LLDADCFREITTPYVIFFSSRLRGDPGIMNGCAGGLAFSPLRHIRAGYVILGS